ncbi:MAG: FtsX-like permease family protein [Spirochaetota bacterium]
MGVLWKIALRNVLRHGKRTAITGIVMMVGIGLFIAYDSILAGMDRISIDTMIDYSSSYLKVRTPGYVSDALGLPLDQGIADPEAVMAAMLKADAGLSAVAPRTLFLVQASNYIDSSPQMAAAVDPLRDKEVFKVAAGVHEGSWLRPTADREAVVAMSVARDLGLKLGDSILLSARTIYDNDNADEFRIVGLIDNTAGLSGTGSIYLSYPAARALLGEGLPVTEIDAAAARAASLDAELAGSARAASLLAAALPGMTSQGIGEFAKDYLALRDSKSKGSFMLIVMILLIAAVGIVNTILMSVYSRVREIGVLRAYGMTAGDVKKLFVREGLITGAAGSVAGLVFGGLLVWYMSSTGLSISGLFGNLDLGAIPVNAVLRGEWKPATFVTGFVFGLLVSWLAARIPAKRAAKLQPTDALRFV